MSKHQLRSLSAVHHFEELLALAEHDYHNGQHTDLGNRQTITFLKSVILKHLKDIEV